MGRRTLLLLAAILVAALGTTGVFLYVTGVDNRARADVRTVEILVANQFIAAGTTAAQASEAGALDRREYFQQSVEGFTPLNDVSGIADQVAITDIPEGSPILASQFSEQAGATSLSIPEGELAVSVTAEDDQRVGGFLGPGSRVAIFVTITEAGTERSVTRPLLTDVQVLAAGQQTAASQARGEAPAEAGQSILTLAVDQEEAEKLIQAKNLGPLHFALMREGSEVGPSDGTDEQSLFN